MQLCESPSGTGDDGLHAPFYNRPTTLLKSKVWLYCINFTALRAPRLTDLTAGFPHEAIPPTPFTHFWQRQCIYWLGFKYPLSQHWLPNMICVSELYECTTDSNSLDQGQPG
jgi:hypothetical protein